jgi:carbamoyl-phosphate synthase large subunit
VLVNSNPATIMTDPELADATYIEPITPEIVASIIEKERPDALLPTMGGQTALNTALSLRRMGVLDKFNVKMIGADAAAIDKAEDRELFREAMRRSGSRRRSPRSPMRRTSSSRIATGVPAEIAAIKARGLRPTPSRRRSTTTSRCGTRASTSARSATSRRA